jgi:hypothetical protein
MDHLIAFYFIYTVLQIGCHLVQAPDACAATPLTATGITAAAGSITYAFDYGAPTGGGSAYTYDFASSTLKCAVNGNAAVLCSTLSGTVTHTTGGTDLAAATAPTGTSLTATDGTGASVSVAVDAAATSLSQGGTPLTSISYSYTPIFSYTKFSTTIMVQCSSLTLDSSTETKVNGRKWLYKKITMTCNTLSTHQCSMIFAIWCV